MHAISSLFSLSIYYFPQGSKRRRNNKVKFEEDAISSSNSLKLSTAYFEQIVETLKIKRNRSSTLLIIASGISSIIL